MPLNATQARDEILTLVKDVTDTIVELGATSANVIWDDTRKQIPAQQDPAATWARVLVRHLDANQATLSDQSGKRRYTRTGLVTIQLFTPLGDGLVGDDTIIEQLLGIFQGVSTPNGVWFRKPRPNEVGNDGPHFHTNVLADFEYDFVG